MNDLVDFSDWLPTCVDLAGRKLPSGFATDGRSFATRLRDNKPAPRKWAYSERGKKRYWVRNQCWKLYDNGKLFNVATDPMEKSPVKKKTRASAAAREKLQKALDIVKH